MRSSKSGNIRTEKIVFLGAQSSGKTSIVNFINNGSFNIDSQSTVGASFLSKTLIINNQNLKLDIWDTAGSEKYKSLTPMYYRDARAAIVVIDLTRSETLDSAEEWIRLLRLNGRNDCQIVAAANKSDLQTQRTISFEMIQDFCFKNQINEWKETSAKNGTGINDLIESMGKLLLSLDPIPSSNDSEIYIIEQNNKIGSNDSKCNC